MLEGLDIAPLIGNGFIPETIAAPEAEAPTLDAALRDAARAAERADATMLDLWLHRPGGANLSALERPALGAQTSWHALAALSGDGGVLDLGSGKGAPLSAANGEDEEEIEIFVIGPSERPNEVDEEGDGNMGGPGAGSYPGGPLGGGGNGGGTPSQQTEDADDTPCVDEAPSGATKDQVNDLAKAASTRLAALQDSTGWEWGAVIYKDSNGELWTSAAFTAQQHSSLTGAVIRIPPGSVIVGYIHTHPIDLYEDQRTLSAADRHFISTLVGGPNARADPNMLTYVATKDLGSDRYSNAYSTYVYDKSDRNSTSPGCDL